MEKEIWKPIIEQCPKFQVSNYGRFRKPVGFDIVPVKVFLNRGGVPTIRMFGRNENALTIIAKAFLPKPEVAGTVVTKDYSVTNLRADNLMWIPEKVNVFEYCMDKKQEALLSSKEV